MVLGATPLGPTFRRLIDFDQLGRNADPKTGTLAAVAFVATSYATNRSVIIRRRDSQRGAAGAPITFRSEPSDGPSK
jgi:hypothetical protein